MKYITTFSNVKVSQVALGCMRLYSQTEKQAEEYLLSAIDYGYNYFDHADIYGKGKSEELFGKALSKHKELRDKIIIQTKCSINNGSYNFSKDYIVKAVEGSLKRLGVDNIDVLLLHRPDLLMEPNEVADAFDALYNSGKVKAFGVSNHSPLQIELLQRATSHKLHINQLQLSLATAKILSSGANVNVDNGDGINRDGYVRDYCRLKGITVQPWSPLQHGFISGTFIDNPDYTELNATLNNLAEKYGVTATGVAIAWLIRLPDNMQPIVGSMNIQRLKEIAVASEVSLSREDWYLLYRVAGYKLP